MRGLRLSPDGSRISFVQVHPDGYPLVNVFDTNSGNVITVMAGYGEAWAGGGGFQDWRQAVDDIGDGARYLVEAGIVDSRRLCIVGWSYGGYAALLSAIEHESLCRCVISIAGVTDPRLLAQNAGNFVGGLGVQAFIGSGDKVRAQGSRSGAQPRSDCRRYYCMDTKTSMCRWSSP